MSHITALTPGQIGLTAGDPELTVLGTGESIPWGVDAVFQYNGLTFNDRGIVDKIRVLSIEGLDDPDIRDIREDNPSEDGETPYDALYGGRTLIFNGRIEAYNRDKLRDLQQAFKAAFADIQEEKPLYFLTNNRDHDHFIMCKKNLKINMSEEQKNPAGYYWRDYQLTLRASNFRFLLHPKRSYNFITNTTNIIANSGTYSAQPVITFIGDMANAEVALELPDNTIKTFKLKTTVTIDAGDYRQVDIAKRTIVDSLGANKFDDVHSDADFFTIPPGQAWLVVPSGKSTGTTASITVEYRDSYI